MNKWFSKTQKMMIDLDKVEIWHYYDNKGRPELWMSINGRHVFFQYQAAVEVFNALKGCIR